MAQGGPSAEWSRLGLKKEGGPDTGHTQMSPEDTMLTKDQMQRTKAV